MADVVRLGFMVSLCQDVLAHIRLTYPPARKPDFDFLENFTTPPPCGVPRGTMNPTNFVGGGTFDVTWAVGAAHPGGIRIEVMSEMYDQTLQIFPDPGTDWFGNDSIQTSQEVTLPAGFGCTNCVMRLTKQDLSHSAYNTNHIYWTCADINVIANSDFNRYCSGNGQWTGTECTCNHLFTGPICQYQNECVDDSDCRNLGRCVDIGATAYPAKQCYCPLGWHGAACSLRSEISNPSTFQPDQYTRHDLRKGLTLYWKLSSDSSEIDMVVQASDVDNWLAVGWKPYGIPTTCKLFPNLPRERRQHRESDGQTRVEYVDFFDNSTLFLEPPLHPMACSDIVWVSVRETYSRIQDMYTRDTSTPRDDTFYGGSDSLTVALASQDSGGLLTLMFRKKVKTNDLADQSITNGWTQLIWAKGQERTQAGIDPTWETDEKERTRIQDFYKPGELKMHGHSSVSRGWEVINFFTGDVMPREQSRSEDITGDPGLQALDPDSMSSSVPSGLSLLCLSFCTMLQFTLCRGILY